MKVIVAKKCGFCPGVRNAISTAEQLLDDASDTESVCSLGPVIHNRDEVKRLEEAGLTVVESVGDIQGGRVLIRSHGAAPSQFESIEKNGAHIVDATCVLVKRLQKIARQLEDEGRQVIIIGEENHPEVQAVVGGLKQAIVITTEKDLAKIPDGAKLGIVSQTTQSPEQFSTMLGAIARGNFRELRAINTLCKESRKRQEAAVKVCKEVDIMFVLGGLHSANTARLAEMCQKFNPKTHHLQSWDDLDTALLADKSSAGVTAGASTPAWIIDVFVKRLESWGDPAETSPNASSETSR
ncbi:MAG: 4-hydroxy-3-methylbut-2-enyl diphosphate reductase [Planctomycetes bacterium]|nr:4-hydroxy-3-methylbut-2-enyl diphosphate reductase [Planctomycetota bacterium]